MHFITSRFLPSRYTENPGILVVRCVVALTMLIHGTYRTAVGSVAGFGGFFESLGLPFGVALAWILTVAEIVGALLLLARVAVVPIALWFAVELATGIVLVHWANGWFVVGGGTGGMEYSVLLIACFVALVLADVHANRIAAAPGGAG